MLCLLLSLLCPTKATTLSKLYMLFTLGTKWWSATQMVLKCADIGHLAAGLKTHKRWAYQLEEEFFRQVSIPDYMQH